MEEEKVNKMHERQEKLKEKLTEETDKQLEQVLEQGINPDNITYVGKLIDIIKDKENIIYWKEKINMYGNRYSRCYNGEYGRSSYNEGSYNEGSYGRRGVKGTGRGRYREGGYGAYNDGGSYNGGRGSGRYRGEDMMDEMYQAYGEYSESKEEYGRGNYGAEQDKMQSFEYMLKSFKDFFKHLEKEADSQEEVEMLKKTAKEIAMM